MFSLFGPEISLKNIYLLSHKYIGSNKIQTTRDLKPYYLDFLLAHQPKQPVNRTPEFCIVDESITESLKQAYRNSSLNDLNQTDLLGQHFEGKERERLISLVKSGYEYLGSVNPKLKEVFDLAIHSIFFVRSNRGKLGGTSFGGSSSTAMGTIWISGHGELTKYDIAEFLVHELTHHLLFIAERCVPQFNYSEMILEENYAQSAILNRKRPMDKVVHSIVVSTEILLARNSFLPPHNIVVHPDSETIRQQTLKSIDEVLALKRLNNVLEPWTITLLERCKLAVEAQGAVAC